MKKNYFKSLAQVAMLLCVPLFIASCDEFGDEDNPIPSYISMSNSPVTITLKYGVDPTFTRTALATSDAAIEYSSEDESIATVDPKTGVVTGVGEGTTKIFAKATGYSTGGKKIFEEATMEYPVTVKDYRANITYALKDTLVASNTWNFKVEPKIWPADGATVVYSYSVAAGDTNPINSFDATDGTIGLLGGANEGKATIKAKITSVPSDYEMDSFKDDNNEVVATFVLEVKEGVAYVDWDETEGKLVNKQLFQNATGDAYKPFPLSVLSGGVLEAGTYFFNNDGAVNFNGVIKLSGEGDVNLLMRTNGNLDAKNGGGFDEDDPSNPHRLNIHDALGANWTSSIDRMVWSAPYSPVDVFKNIGEINIYGTQIFLANCASGYGDFVNIGSVNVYGAVIQCINWANDNSFAFKMKEGGTITLHDGSINVSAKGDETYAVKGNVVLKKGTFSGSNAEYKAVSGTLTADTEYEFQESEDGTEWAPITGNTSAKKYVKSVKK